MPAYDFRCKDCQTEFSLFYKSYKDYEAASRACPNCQATALDRIIKKVNVAAPSRDYTRMKSNEMLSVLESGNPQQVQELYKQVGAASPEQTAKVHEKVKKTLGSKAE